jgi:hypothetical protein
MSFSLKILRWLFVRPEPPKPHVKVAMSFEDQREKVIKLLLTAQALAVDLGDAALVEKIKKAGSSGARRLVRQA